MSFEQQKISRYSQMFLVTEHVVSGPSVLVSGGFGELNMNNERGWEGAGGPLPDVRERAGGRLHSEVQDIIGNGYMGNPSEQTEWHKWKHYLPTTSLAGGNTISLPVRNLHGAIH